MITMVTIGHVTLPSDWRVRRATDSLGRNVGIVEVPSDYDKAYNISSGLPRIRYTGTMQTSDMVAITKLDALIEMFNNPDIDYPLFINADEEFYFLLISFNYEKPGGYRKYWSFNLDVLWLGTNEVLSEIYINENFTKEDNDWNL